jgi:hypothetical protein
MIAQCGKPAAWSARSTEDVYDEIDASKPLPNRRRYGFAAFRGRHIRRKVADTGRSGLRNRTRGGDNTHPSFPQRFDDGCADPLGAVQNLRSAFRDTDWRIVSLSHLVSGRYSEAEQSSVETTLVLDSGDAAIAQRKSRDRLTSSELEENDDDDDDLECCVEGDRRASDPSAHAHVLLSARRYR